MKHVIILFSIFLAWTAIGVDWYVCKVKQQCRPSQLIEHAQAEASNIRLSLDETHIEKDIQDMTAKDIHVEKTAYETATNTSFEIEGESIFFPLNQSAPEKSLVVKDYLHKVAKALKENIHATIDVSGFTDNTGNAQTNERLSKRRAQTIAHILETHGVDRERIKVNAYGESMAKYDNSTAEGRQKNRRVDVHINQ